jgi:DNA gyrase subunit B
MAKRVERHLRDSRVVELLTNPDWKLDTKADFVDRTNLQPLLDALKALKLAPECQEDEEHSTWTVTFNDPTSARRSVGLELASQPEYRRMRALARQVGKLNRPPFVVVKETAGQSQASWRDLLNHLKAEGMKDASIQRYKGLGEMNAEQLWETTMNAETRTLLRVELKDLVESDEIFSTLMGEDVENRRKFIEDNALDVRNLDV